MDLKFQNLSGKNDKELFLSTFLDQSQKVIRKIDKLDKAIEDSFTSLILSLIELSQEEQFLKDQVKSQKDFNLKDVYLEILDLSGDQTTADAEGVCRFIFKYSDQVVQQEKVMTHLISKRMKNLRNDFESKEIVFEHFNKIFSTQNKSVIVTNSTPGVPSSWN